MGGVENKIDNPSPSGHGAICFHGCHVFMDYLGEEAKTREAVDEDSWLYSGDIGRVVEDGQWKGMGIVISGWFWGL